MADALFHRGPDEDGYLEIPGLSLTNRRLSIVGLHDGKQPIWNEDRSIVTVFNGEFFDYPEVRQMLEGRGHRFATHCDTEIIPHLWEDHGEDFFKHLRGQFAIALWDSKQRRLILTRDRFGICPLFWTRQGDWLLFASEIKSLLASGMVQARPDLRGLDQVFNFFAVPGPATCFEGIKLLQPGHYLRIQMGTPGEHAKLEMKTYWRIDFPDAGQEEDGPHLVDEFDKTLLASVDRRLRADVPVVSYLSGGIDSSIVVAMAAKIRGESVPTFTIQIKAPKLDETDQAAVVSRHIGAHPIIVPVGDSEILANYAELIRAAEAPVIDTSCIGLLLLARAVHDRGYKVALTGEGSDEWLAGYMWYKVDRVYNWFNFVPGLTTFLRRMTLLAMGAPKGSYKHSRKVLDYLGEQTAFQDLYSVINQSRMHFFSRETLEGLGDYCPYRELEPDLDRMKRWHRLNRSFFFSGRIHLAGHLLSLKGDRIAMNSSVETRYPFLDEEVFNFLAKIHPHWKLRGFQDKYILRLVGERYLPKEVAWRPKGMFRAPFDSFFSHGVPAYVNQLLSPESLRKTGYFDVDSVRHWAKRVKDKDVHFRRRSAVELGLVGVLATQLWHHTFIDGSLADMPSGWQKSRLVKASA